MTGTAPYDVFNQEDSKGAASGSLFHGLQRLVPQLVERLEVTALQLDVRNVIATQRSTLYVVYLEELEFGFSLDFVYVYFKICS